MPLTDADEFMKQLEIILAPIPEGNKAIMKEWARREIVLGSPIVLATKKSWIDAYDAANGATVPAGYHVLSWRVGHASPQNPAAIVFAMFDVPASNGGPTEIHVYSFDTSGDGVAWFKEKVFQPDTTFGPLTGEGLFEDLRALLATEEEEEELAARDEKAARADPNGARAS